MECNYYGTMKFIFYQESKVMAFLFISNTKLWYKGIKFDDIDVM